MHASYYGREAYSDERETLLALIFKVSRSRMKTNNLPLEQAKLAFKVKEQEIKVEQIKLSILETLWRIEMLEHDRHSGFLTDDVKARIGLKISSRYCEIETLKLDQKLEEMTLANLRNQWTELLVSD